MRAVATERQRRFFVRVRAGEDLLEAVEALAQREELQAAWIRGVGALERAELEHETLDEPCEVLSLSGSLAWDGDDVRPRLRVTLAPLAAGGRVVGGVLRRAPATDLQLVVESFDDVPVELVTTPNRTPRIVASAPPSRALVEPSFVDEDDYDDEEDADAAPAAVSWADVAKASAVVEAMPEPPPPRAPRAPVRPHEPPPRPSPTSEPTVEHRGPTPEKGDFVQHVQFGLCKVEKADGRGGIVIKLPSGLRKKLRLDFMDVGRPRRDEGRRVFPVRPRKR